MDQDYDSWTKIHSFSLTTAWTWKKRIQKIRALVEMNGLDSVIGNGPNKIVMPIGRLHSLIPEVYPVSL